MRNSEAYRFITALIDEGRRILESGTLLGAEILRALKLEENWTRKGSEGLARIPGHSRKSDELRRTGPTAPSDSTLSEQGHVFKERMTNKLYLLDLVHSQL